MVKIFKYLTKKEFSIIFISILFIIFQVWLDLRLPDYMSEITMLVQTEGNEMSDILTAGGKMLVCAVGSLISSISVAILSSRIASNFSAILRERLFNKVQSFSMEEIGHFSTASLITRSTNDVTQVQMFIVMGLQSIIKAPILAVWAICKIADKSWQWTMSTAAAVVILFIAVIICISLAMPWFKRMQSFNDDLNRVTRENLTGIRVVHAYNAENYQTEKFEKSNKTLTHAHLYTGRVMAALMPSIQLVMNGLSLSIYWIGAYLIDHAEMTDKIALFSDMVVFLSYAMQVVMAFMMLVMIFIIFPRASVSAKRILEVLETKTKIKDGSFDESDTEIKGEIEFRNVCFHYPDAPNDVIKDISFKAHKGETVALIGSTGCGKSTVINLIPRFYDATSGEVIVDGKNVREYTQHSLRNKIGYVSQKSFLFSGDIKSNIAYGDNGRNDFSVENINEAIEISQSEEFVSKKSDGINSHVAQGGTNYSGGQKQRISIARAICRNPEIFIFDDSFSALDYKTDKILRSALKEKCKDATKIIVAQRIGTIRDADRIIVLDKGNIAGIGTHSELMKSCSVYQQIAYSQLSKEELE